MAEPQPVSSTAPWPEWPPVRLDVRLGTGKLTSFSIDASEFLIGGSPGCDLGLPGSQLPPLIATLRRTTPEHIVLRRADPAFPVLVNGRLLSDQPVQLQHGDRLAIGSADATLVIGEHHLRPSFIPIEDVIEVASPEELRNPSLDDERAVLESLRQQLREQARELEADRVLWYKRRNEIEAEIEQLKASARVLASPEAQNLEQVRAELIGIRQQLFEEYQKRRDELVQLQGVIRGASESLNQREQQFEARQQAAEQELADRRRLLDLEAAELRQLREQSAGLNVAEREAQLQADALRLERWQARLDEQQREVDHRAREIDLRYEQLTRDTRDWEEQLGLAQAEQARLISETARIEQQRQEAEKLAEQLAQRAAQLDAQQASLAVLRARLDRQQLEANLETKRLQEQRERLDQAQQELDQRLRDAEQLRAELQTLQQGAAEKSRVVDERAGLLDATLAELEQQKQSLQDREQRLNDREAALDSRSVELAEQTAMLTARANQILELQQRLDADRAALRTRELSLSESDSARLTFQDQLRRRAEELAARSKHLDELAAQLTSQTSELEQQRQALSLARQELDNERQLRDAELQQRVAQVEQQARDLAQREASLSRQIERLKEVGRQVAASRRELQNQRRQWTEEQQRLDSSALEHQQALEALQAKLPELQQVSQHALEQLQAGRERLRGHLAELHQYANTTRAELEAQRLTLRQEAEQLRQRELLLEQVRAEHRLALAEFRQQVLDWQSRLGEVRATVNRTETHLANKQAEVSAAVQLAEAAAVEIAQQKEELRQERLRITERRAEVERQLAELREWYRRKLRELAKSRSSVEPVSTLPFKPDELDPGDRQLGELLLRLDLVDPESLATLWQQAQTQRRSLRHVLLVSGVLTLYQLALIESGNLDGLMLGRFRVIDRVSQSPAETIYRVYDPTRSTLPSRGIYLLRWLAESELEDPVRPDEYFQRFTILSETSSPQLHRTLEVLMLQQRPAVLQEWLMGVTSNEWPSDVTSPGIWLKLLREVALALDAIHKVDLVHGRLTTTSVLLSPTDGVKLLNAGEPDWLHGEPPDVPPTPEQDLRSLGQVALLWLGLDPSNSTKKRHRGKGFPETLQAVLRRLEAVGETPMGDTVAGAVPYRSSAELVEDLTRLSQVFPCSPEAWQKLLKQLGEVVETPVPPIRRSA